MTILVTGAAGFIGNNFLMQLANIKKNTKIIGLDNINNYYSKKNKNLREERFKKKKYKIL